MAEGMARLHRAPPPPLYLHTWAHELLLRLMYAAIHLAYALLAAAGRWLPSPRCATPASLRSVDEMEP